MQPVHSPPPSEHLVWDIFCRVIDNFGDLGVCWRLSADLARRGHTVRLFIDEARALQWMAPGALEGHWPGVQVLDWEQSKDPQGLAVRVPADVWVEGFGCEIAPELIAYRAGSTWASGINGSKFPVWINLEYLSAEKYVERAHTLPSPVMQGPAKGHTKYFFYPGFGVGTGGLLREPGLAAAHQPLRNTNARRQWLADHGVQWQGEFLVSLFCYEPDPLQDLLEHWTRQSRPTRLLVTSGRAASAVKTALDRLVLRARPAPLSAGSPLQITYLPALSQARYDELLHCCDLNFVRGEDSLVRAIWAGQPLVWHIYPQDDDAHHAKLMAFLVVLQAPENLVRFHQRWNGMEAVAPVPGGSGLLPDDLGTWRDAVQALQTRLLQMNDLTTELIGFVQKKR